MPAIQLCKRYASYAAFVFATHLLLAGVVSLSAQSHELRDGPAVSGLNGKLSIQGGTFDYNGAGLALGSLTLPLGHTFGLQFDGAVAKIDGDVLRGGGVHLFHRDPARYLIGAYASYHKWDEQDIWRVAAETELYLGQFSFEGLAGIENTDGRLRLRRPVDARGDLLVQDFDDGHFFAIADFAFYIHDDLRLSAGYRYVDETSLGAVEGEWLFAGLGAPVSAYAQGIFGDGDHERIMGGVKIYFGADRSKSLLRRHREDDPKNHLPEFIRQAEPTCPAGFEQEGRRCVKTPPPEHSEPSPEDPEPTQQSFN